MSSSFDQDRSQSGPTQDKAPVAARAHFRIRLVVMLVICAAATFWASRTVWEHAHPSAALARTLHSSDPDQRSAAIREIGALGQDESGLAVEYLTPVLRDPDATVRRDAAEALSRVGAGAITAGKDPETVRAAVKQLFAALHDSDASVRMEAASALTTLADVASGAGGRARGRGKSKTEKPASPSSNLVDDQAVVAALLKLLADSDTEVRRIALLGVGKLASKGSGNPPQALYSAIEDQSPVIREAAFTALTGFAGGLDPLIPTLLRHAEHDDPVVQAACARALSRIKPSALSAASTPLLITGLQNRNRDVRLHLVTLIGRMSPEPSAAVPALITVLREPAESDQQRIAGTMMMVSYAGPAQEAAQVLGRLAPGTPAASQAIAALTEMVQSGSPKRRAAAARSLAQFGRAASGAAGALITLLHDAETAKQLTEDGPAAARALGQIAPGTSEAKKAATALADAFNSSAAPIREAAVGALASFHQNRADLTDVIARLRDLHEKDRVQAIRDAAASALEKLTTQPSAGTNVEISKSKSGT